MYTPFGYMRPQRPHIEAKDRGRILGVDHGCAHPAYRTEPCLAAGANHCNLPPLHTNLGPSPSLQWVSIAKPVISLFRLKKPCFLVGVLVTYRLPKAIWGMGSAGTIALFSPNGRTKVLNLPLKPSQFFSMLLC